MDELIDTDVLFQALLTGIAIDGVTYAADVDVDSFESVPFVTHSAQIAMDRNGRGLWSCNLTVTAFIEISSANFSTLQALYAGIHTWGLDPTAGVLPGVAGVESVEDIQAFTRVGQSVEMLNKVVTQYVGSFELSIRNH